MARATRDMEARNILLPSPHRAVPHPAPRRCHRGGASPAGALPSAQMGSTPARFCRHPFSYGARHNPATQRASGRPTPGRGRGTPPMPGSMGKNLHLLLPASPPTRPQPQPPRPPAVGGFWPPAQNKSEEEEGPGAADKQLPIESLFWLTQKTQTDSAPLRSTLGSIRVVPRTPGPGEPWLHPTDFRSPLSGSQH